MTDGNNQEYEVGMLYCYALPSAMKELLLCLEVNKDSVRLQWLNEPFRGQILTINSIFKHYKRLTK